MTINNHESHDRLYDDLAWTWPIISPPEDYVEEGEFFIKILREYQKRDTKTVLNLGCGGGHVDWVLKRALKVTGVDISKNMLALAHRLNPEAEYIRGDMRDIRLNRKFDAVVIHDAVNYMITPEDLQAAFTTAAEHLDPEGIFLTYVEEWPEHFVQNRVRHYTKKKGNIQITLADNHYDPDPTDTSYEYTMIFLIRRDGKLDIQYDRHIAGIFPLSEWETAFRKAGFEMIRIEAKPIAFEVDEELPMFIGIKK